MPTSRLTWDQFDALPRVVRDALNYAAFRYSIRGGIVPPDEADKRAASIRATDAKQIAASQSAAKHSK